VKLIDRICIAVVVAAFCVVAAPCLSADELADLKQRIVRIEKALGLQDPALEQQIKDEVAKAHRGETKFRRESVQQVLKELQNCENDSRLKDAFNKKFSGNIYQWKVVVHDLVFDLSQGYWLRAADVEYGKVLATPEYGTFDRSLQKGDVIVVTGILAGSQSSTVFLHHCLVRKSK
jgi:predicted secreted protein